MSGLIDAAVASYAPGLDGTNLLHSLTGWVMRAGGPLAVFTGNWALIDV